VHEVEAPEDILAEAASVDDNAHAGYTGAGDDAAHRSKGVEGDGEDPAIQEMSEQSSTALVGLEGTEWMHALKSPNAKAWQALFGEGAPQADLVVISYSIFESQEATRGLGWKFYEDMLLQAAPGTVRVFRVLCVHVRASLP
jgi:hypothetical protein